MTTFTLPNLTKGKGVAKKVLYEIDSKDLSDAMPWVALKAFAQSLKTNIDNEIMNPLSELAMSLGTKTEKLEEDIQKIQSRIPKVDNDFEIDGSGASEEVRTSSELHLLGE